VTYGVGAAFNIGTSFVVRGEYEAFDISGGSFDVLSVSGAYKF
jgi:opacity protein-like surface antigen